MALGSACIEKLRLHPWLSVGDVVGSHCSGMLPSDVAQCAGFLSARDCDKLYRPFFPMEQIRHQINGDCAKPIHNAKRAPDKGGVAFKLSMLKEKPDTFQ